jgi:hypothetical protein
LPLFIAIYAEAHANLSDLLRRRLRTEDAVFEERGRLTSWMLDRRYNDACLTPSDLQEHLPVLRDLAEQCRHVTDAGTGAGVSALAFLRAQPERLVCIGLVQSLEVDNLKALRGPTDVESRRADVLSGDIEETDLLFLDTRHNAGQLREELRRHAGKARKFIVTHGTTAHATEGESAREGGVWPVVEEFLAEGSFCLRKRYENNHGLTVLERVEC